MPGANTALSALAVLGVLSAGLRLVFAPGIKRLVGLACLEKTAKNFALFIPHFELTQLLTDS